MLRPLHGDLFARWGRAHRRAASHGANLNASRTAETTMIDDILASLPPDVQEDLTVRTNALLNVRLLHFPSEAPMDDRLIELIDLAKMPPADVLSYYARWTAYASYISELLTFTTIVLKRVEHFFKIEQNAIRVGLGSKPAPPASEVAQAIFADMRARCLDEAVQSLQELRAVLETRERACRAAAEAASRAITSHQTEVERLRLEVRRG